MIIKVEKWSLKIDIHFDIQLPLLLTKTQTTTITSINSSTVIVLTPVEPCRLIRLIWFVVSDVLTSRILYKKVMDFLMKVRP